MNQAERSFEMLQMNQAERSFEMFTLRSINYVTDRAESSKLKIDGPVASLG